MGAAEAAALRLLLTGFGKELRKLAAFLVLLVLVVFLFFTAAVGALVVTLAGRGGAGSGPPSQPLGPAYNAGTCNLGAGTLGADALRRASRRDLCFGASDAARVERLIAALQPNSPLLGRGAAMLRLGQQHGVDPLLIAMWKIESQMATVGLNIPANGNWNGGNLIWEAAEPYAAKHGCRPGGTSLDHRWALCPTAEGGSASGSSMSGHPPSTRTPPTSPIS